MKKFKPHEGILKRVKITARGKVLARGTGRRHLLSAKRAKVKRQKRRLRQILGADAQRLKRLVAR